MRVVLATRNPGKGRELRALLAPCGIELATLGDFTLEQAEETAPTFVENALLKARHASRASGLPALADDSGLAVDALGGRPGIHSARYAGDAASDSENLERLLADLAGVPLDQRGAHYHCSLVLLRHAQDPAPLIVDAHWHGRIIEAPRGTAGFGYDPVFEIPELGLTAAELPAVEKNRISHRGRALAALIAALRGSA